MATPDFASGAFVVVRLLLIPASRHSPRGYYIMKIRLLAGVATLALCAASGASAQSALSGWYVAGDVGYHTTDGVKASSSTGASDWTFSAKDDWAAFGRLGYKLTPNWRV